MLSRYLSLLILFFIFGFSGDSGNMSFFVASSGNLLLFPECLEQTTSVTSSSLPSRRNTLCTSSRLFVCYQVDMDLPDCLSLSVVFTLFLWHSMTGMVDTLVAKRRVCIMDWISPCRSLLPRVWCVDTVCEHWFCQCLETWCTE